MAQDKIEDSPGGNEQKEKAKGGPAVFPEPVWTYRGYSLRASEFSTAMVHMFRAEVQRANVWRQRLDTTTNWAVVTTGAVLSFAFATPESPHIVIPLILVLVTLFLFIESRRYRYYELWSYRVRLMETDFFAAMLVPPFQPSSDWAESLAEHLLQPHFSVSNWEALGRRLRRNYLWIYTVIIAAWFAKLWLLPVPIDRWSSLVARAHLGSIPGIWIITAVLLFFAALVVISIATIGLQAASGEVLPRYVGVADTLASATEVMGKGPHSVRAWFRPKKRRKQLLALIITDQAESVSQRVLSEMNRGVTSLSGKGMYTGQQHSVLMCAMTLTEIPHLKALVHETDENAFVIVAPAQEVFGRGFMSLEEEE